MSLWLTSLAEGRKAPKKIIGQSHPSQPRDTSIGSRQNIIVISSSSPLTSRIVSTFRCRYFHNGTDGKSVQILSYRSGDGDFIR